MTSPLPPLAQANLECPLPLKVRWNKSKQGKFPLSLVAEEGEEEEVEGFPLGSPELQREEGVEGEEEEEEEVGYPLHLPLQLQLQLPQLPPLRPKRPPPRLNRGELVARRVGGKASLGDGRICCCSEQGQPLATSPEKSRREALEVTFTTTGALTTGLTTITVENLLGG